MNLSIFIISHMIEGSLDPSSLSYRLIITHIFEVSNIPLKVVPSIVVNQCYNTNAFGIMGCVLVDDICISMPDGGFIGTPSPKSRISPPHVPSSFLFYVTIRMKKMDLKLDSIKDLLLASHILLTK